MVTGVIQIFNEKLSTNKVKEICRSLKEDTLTSLSLRKCSMEEDNFKRLMKAVGRAKSLQQLNLNLGPVTDIERTSMLVTAMNTNRSIRSLYLHGCPLEEHGMEALIKSLCLHPHVVDVDFGDCLLGDHSLKLLCNLLPPDGARPGIKDLVLSANPAITSYGWSMLFCAVAASSNLQSLTIDYNPAIGDAEAKMLAVAIAGSSTLQSVDLEGCNLTNQSAQIFLDMIENYPTTLRQLVLAENRVNDELQEEIAACLQSIDADTDFSD